MFRFLFVRRLLAVQPINSIIIEDVGPCSRCLHAAEIMPAGWTVRTTWLFSEGQQVFAGFNQLRPVFHNLFAT
jgi:hypothetical protein